MLSRLTISNKLYLIILTLVVALITLGATFYHTQSLSRESEKTQQAFERIFDRVHQLEVNVLLLRQYEKNFLLQKDTAQLEQHENVLARVDASLATLSDIAQDPVQRKALTRVKENIDNYRQRFVEVTQLMTQIGLSEKEGYLGWLRKLVHKVENTLKREDELEVSVSMLMLRRHEKDFLAREDWKYVKRHGQELDNNFFRYLKDSYMDDMTIRLVTQQIQQYRAAFLKVADATNAINEKTAEFHQAVSSITPSLEQLVKHTHALSETANRETQNVSQQAAYVYYGTLLVLCLTLIPFISWTNRSIHQSIHNVVTMLKRIATGDADLNYRLPVTTQDEMGEMATNFNRFMDKLQTMLNSIRDLSQRLNQLSEQAQQTSIETGQEISQQTVTISNTADAISTLSTAVSGVTQHAQHAAEQTQTANQSASTGAEKIQELINSTHRLADSVHSASIKIKTLDKETDAIGDVLNLISDIAEQTTLLALNAAIESARAGQHGRGFAVIADEVRLLSEHTHQATDDIRSLILELQQSTKEVLTMMDSSVNLAKSNVDQSSTANESLTQLTQMIDEITRCNSDIATLTSQQNTISDTINHQFNQVNDVIQSISESAQTMASDRGDLAQNAVLLDTLTDDFCRSKNSQKEKTSLTEKTEEIELFV